MKSKNYKKYQLEWMIRYGYSLEDLINELERLRLDLIDMEKEDGIHVDLNIVDIFNNWEREIGFDGHCIWACQREWEDWEGNMVQLIKQEYLNDEVSMIAILSWYPELTDDEIQELLEFSGDDEYMTVEEARAGGVDV